MTGEEMVAILAESHRAVLRTHGIDPATFLVAELEASAAESE